MQLADGSSAFVWKQITANHQTELPLDYVHWYPGEPNAPNTEFCLALFQQVNYAWIDLSCDYELNVVCEIDIA